MGGLKKFFKKAEKTLTGRGNSFLSHYSRFVLPTIYLTDKLRKRAGLTKANISGGNASLQTNSASSYSNVPGTGFRRYSV